MSSTRKDTRWQLAHDRVDSIGMSWDQLTSVGQSAALAAAEAQLDSLPVRAVEILAERWNAPPVDPASLVRDKLLDILQESTKHRSWMPTVLDILNTFDVTLKGSKS